jgi:hypothetical protein
VNLQKTEDIQLLGAVPARIHPLELLPVCCGDDCQIIINHPSALAAAIDQTILCLFFSFISFLDGVVQILWEMRV